MTNLVFSDKIVQEVEYADIYDKIVELAVGKNKDVLVAKIDCKELKKIRRNNESKSKYAPIINYNIIGYEKDKTSEEERKDEYINPKIPVNETSTKKDESFIQKKKKR
jgi:hypothetical protein